MKVLILSVTAGFGHHATARAVSDMLAAKGAEPLTLDIYKYINRAVQHTIDKGYLFSSKHTPELYRLCYALAENHGQSYFSIPKLNIINIVNALGTTKFERVISDFAPDAIVCTHVFAAQLVNEMKKHQMVTAPAVGIVTDYTMHPYWEDVPQIEHIVTASELISHLAVKRGIAADRLLPYGIPIHPKFNHEISRRDACAQLGIEPTLPTILMMGGSMGYSNNKKLITQLQSVGLPFQLLAVCGRNKKQYQQLTEMLNSFEGPCTLYPYGFVDNVEIMMSAADCIVTKPGGLTVSEALAKNLPMILVDPIPGHEERNVEFLLNNGIASLVTKTFPIDEAVYHLFTNPARLQTVRETMRAIGHPNATERLADFVLTMAAN
ncbi:MAG: glycosyltransferase [Intestinibacillus sp.]